MANALSNAAVWLDGVMRDHASSAVVYARGSGSVETVARLGRSEFEQLDAAGATHRSEFVDFIIAAADLAAFGDPRVGDTVSISRGGRDEVYEVSSPGRSSPPWAWSDVSRLSRRIHTILKSSEASA